MFKTIALLLLILSLILYTVTVQSDTCVIVRPLGSNSSVCGDYAACDTLNNLLSRNSTLFTDSTNLQVVFLKGRHEVNASNMQLKIERKKNVTWFGDSAVIVCKTALSFIFSEIEFLEIQNLIFSKCGNKFGSIYSSVELSLQNIPTALFLKNIYRLHLNDVRVYHSKGYGVLVLNVYGSACLSHCKFMQNNKKCAVQQPRDACVGGNVAVYFIGEGNNINMDKPVKVSITNCTIRDGRDMSKAISSCEVRHKMASSPTAFRANGLAIVFAQKNYQVHVNVYETNFS